MTAISGAALAVDDERKMSPLAKMLLAPLPIEIEQGRFGLFRTGQTKHEVFVSLIKEGQNLIYVDIPTRRKATSSADLSYLIDAPALVIKDVGYIAFVDDEIGETRFLGTGAEWFSELKEAKNRDEVFVVLNALFDDGKISEVVEEDRSSGWIVLDQITQVDLDKLGKFDLWRTSISDRGYWVIELFFEEGVLAKMELSFSLHELP
ncbi:MAG: hypothetical protein GY788_20305 [bacterium]|nr:hypothetical protein [bacterium]